MGKKTLTEKRPATTSATKDAREHPTKKSKKHSTQQQAEKDNAPSIPVTAEEDQDGDIQMESAVPAAGTGSDDEDQQEELDIAGQHDDESGDEEGSNDDVEDEDVVDQEAIRKSNARKAHTSDRVASVMTNPEIEAAFQQQYMTQITEAFGDELNTLRETDNLDGPHLELLIDSLNQTGQIFRPLEKELHVNTVAAK